MTTMTLSRPTVKSDPNDLRTIPYCGVHINGKELSRIQAARRSAYYARPASSSLDDTRIVEAMEVAGRAVLVAIQAEHDAELDRQADESAMNDRYESGFLAL